MKRIKDTFLDSIEKVIPLSGKKVLEIGCGNGSRSVQISKRCSYLIAIEPHPELIGYARENSSSQNIEYSVGKAEDLGFPEKEFDIAFFTLSLHHVPTKLMKKAINEAVRVTKKGGNVIFLEPTESGTFFDAEISFDACDGDERPEKSAAYNALRHYPQYEEVAELQDETIFQFSSLDDFIQSMSPKKNTEEIASFLKKNDFILRASRRINIFRV